MGFPFFYGYPYYYPYSYYYPYAYGYSPYGYPPYGYYPPNVTVIYPPASTEYPQTGAAAEQPAPVIVNQNFHPEYLIAFTNGTVKTAVAYWSEDGTFHYIDSKGQQMTAPMSQIDRARSQQLNKERGLTFGLPDSTGAAQG